MNISCDLMCDFDLMSSKAHSSVKNQSKNAQILVLKTRNGKIYVFENDITKNNAIEDEIINKLISNNDTQIDLVLCMWDIGGIDVPSYYFRTMLYKMNSENLNTKIFLQGFDGLHIKELRVTIKY